MLLTTILSTWQFTQFSVHLRVCFSSWYFIGLSLRMLWETDERLAKVTLNNIQFSLLRHQASHIVEGSQVCQDWFAFCRSVVTTSNHFSVNVFGEGDQDYLVYHISRYRGEANQSIVPQILLLAFESMSDICLLPALGNHSNLTDLLWHSWMHSIMSHRFLQAFPHLSLFEIIFVLYFYFGIRALRLL